MFAPRDFRVFIPCVVLLIVQSSYGSEITEGKEVEPHSLPFMVLLQSTERCGGTLIDPKWVLTAAHCKNMTVVVLGVHSIKAMETNSRQVLRVKKSYPHSSFDKKTHVNDLMLLQLDNPAKQTGTVKCLKLGDSIEDPKAGNKCLVAGWGMTERMEISDVLMSVNVTVVDRKKCNSSDYYNHNPVITDSMICAGSDGKNSADTCKGDSGGPLLCNGALVGVTSFGKGCGVIKKPGVYTFLTQSHLAWIKKTMNGGAM
ncbi:granzyme A-like [Mugil cephalus]|uniref:granzyme A-like n=1 Tax=Mugil cephalus TaxID=48193 RepID=UPI001FB5A010|nr:granzyme A-like [Mugil cephalus]